MHRAVPRALGLALAAGLLAGCSGGAEPGPAVVEGTSVAEPGPACTPAPAVAAGLPAGFPLEVALPAGSVVTATGEAGGQPFVTARVQDDVAGVLAHFRTALPAAGAFVGRDEDEGRSGQLTFLSGAVEGGVTVARQRCPEGSTGWTLSARRTR